MASPKTVYIIAGPTAVGKTSVAISLAKKLQTSIISADSRQCYKELTIGTAKPLPEELELVKHYFINEFSVTTSLSAADFESLSLGYLDEIFATANNAIVCGGTGLYIKALCEGLDDMPPVNEEIANEVHAQYLLNGIAWLQQAVANEDPEFHSIGEIQNPARLLRALIFKRSNKNSIVNYRLQAKKPRPFRIIKIGLELPRETLYKYINERVDGMITLGLLTEAQLLYPLKHLKNLQTVGYSEIFDHMDGKFTLDIAVEKIKQHTRQYAKRQLTWFKKDAEINWLCPRPGDDITEVILGLK